MNLFTDNDALLCRHLLLRVTKVVLDVVQVDHHRCHRPNGKTQCSCSTLDDTVIDILVQLSPNDPEELDYPYLPFGGVRSAEISIMRLEKDRLVYFRLCR
jgi:hypothetical protein